MRDLISKFMSRVDKNGPATLTTSGVCWVWIKSKNDKGYGWCKMLGECKAHRVSYRLFVGDIPDGKMVLHKCDNPSCVNPLHLLLGNQEVNMSDMTTKNRQAQGDRHGAVIKPWTVARGAKHGSHTKPHKIPRGIRHGCCRLSENDVLAIRKRYASGEQQKTLANEYKVHKGTVYKIVTRLIWTHI